MSDHKPDPLCADCDGTGKCKRLVGHSQAKTTWRTFRCGCRDGLPHKIKEAEK